MVGAEILRAQDWNPCWASMSDEGFELLGTCSTRRQSVLDPRLHQVRMMEAKVAKEMVARRMVARRTVVKEMAALPWCGFELSDESAVGEVTAATRIPS